LSPRKIVETQTQSILPNFLKRVGIAADHAGFELKEFLAGKIRAAGHELVDFGDRQPPPDDDYPDFVVPLARAVAAGEFERGIAICGSGVGASVAANKVAGVRACLIHETFSARQGVEDDDLNLICLGGLVIGHATAWELVETFLAAQFSSAERHRRRLGKVSKLETTDEFQAVKTNPPDDHADGQGLLGTAPNPLAEATIASEALAAVSATGRYPASPKLHPLTVMPHCDGVAIPLEDARITWQR
jgi:ribose 5-phosphate isomerase B